MERILLQKAIEDGVQKPDVESVKVKGKMRGNAQHIQSHAILLITIVVVEFLVSSIMSLTVSCFDRPISKETFSRIKINTLPPDIVDYNELQNRFDREKDQLNSDTIDVNWVNTNECIGFDGLSDDQKDLFWCNATSIGEETLHGMRLFSIKSVLCGHTSKNGCPRNCPKTTGHVDIPDNNKCFKKADGIRYFVRGYYGEVSVGTNDPERLVYDLDLEDKSSTKLIGKVVFLFNTIVGDGKWAENKLGLYIPSNHYDTRVSIHSGTNDIVKYVEGSGHFYVSDNDPERFKDVIKSAFTLTFNSTKENTYDIRKSEKAPLFYTTDNIGYACEDSGLICSKDDIADFMLRVSEPGYWSDLTELNEEYLKALSEYNDKQITQLNTNKEALEEMRKQYGELEDDFSKRKDSFLHLGFLGYVFNPPDFPEGNFAVMDDFDAKEIMRLYDELQSEAYPKCMLDYMKRNICDTESFVRNVSLNTFDDIIDEASSTVKWVMQQLSLIFLASNLLFAMIYALPEYMDVKKTAKERIISVVSSIFSIAAALTPLIFLTSLSFIPSIFGLEWGDLNDYLIRNGGVLCDKTKDQIKSEIACLNNCYYDTGQIWTKVKGKCETFLKLPKSFKEEYLNCTIARDQGVECKRSCLPSAPIGLIIPKIYYEFKSGIVGMALSLTVTLSFPIIDSLWISGWVAGIKRGNFFDSPEIFASRVCMVWAKRSIGPGVSAMINISLFTLALTDSYLYMCLSLIGYIIFHTTFVPVCAWSASKVKRRFDRFKNV